MEHIGFILTAVAVVLVVIVLAVSYVKAPPDMAYIISGLQRRTVIGGANFRVPFLLVGTFGAKILEKGDKEG